MEGGATATAGGGGGGGARWGRIAGKSLGIGFENQRTTLLLWVQTSIGGLLVDLKASLFPAVLWINCTSTLFEPELAPV